MVLRSGFCWAALPAGIARHGLRLRARADKDLPGRASRGRHARRTLRGDLDRQRHQPGPPPAGRLGRGSCVLPLLAPFARVAVRRELRGGTFAATFFHRRGAAVIFRARRPFLVALLWPLLSRSDVVFYDWYVGPRCVFFWIVGAGHLKRNNYLQPAGHQRGLSAAFLHRVDRRPPSGLGAGWARKACSPLSRAWWAPRRSSSTSPPPPRCSSRGFAAVYLVARTFVLDRLTLWGAPRAGLRSSRSSFSFTPTATSPNLLGALAGALVVVGDHALLRLSVAPRPVVVAAGRRRSRPALLLPRDGSDHRDELRAAGGPGVAPDGLALRGASRRPAGPRRRRHPLPQSRHHTPRVDRPLEFPRGVPPIPRCSAGVFDSVAPGRGAPRPMATLSVGLRPIPRHRRRACSAARSSSPPPRWRWRGPRDRLGTVVVLAGGVAIVVYTVLHRFSATVGKSPRSSSASFSRPCCLWGTNLRGLRTSPSRLSVGRDLPASSPALTAAMFAGATRR